MAVIVRNSPVKPSGGQKTVSLCMIVKNEEKMLKQCLTSLKPLVNEIVLVDTGSTDRTIEIAESFGARVFHFKWIDDFAAARNFSIEQAKCDWILTLDADEAIAERDYPEFRRLIKKAGVCWEFLERHYSDSPQFSNFKPCKGEYAEWERSYGGYFESGRVRLFPRDREITFKGQVHELVEHAIRVQPKYRIERSTIPIHHYGHTKDRGSRAEKPKLYTHAGEAKLKSDPNNWQSHFEMGVEHTNNGRFAESVSYFRKAGELNPVYSPIWTNLGYVLCEIGQYQEALKTLQHALKIDPRDYEAYGNLGVVYLRTQNYTHAANHLMTAIKLNPDFVIGYCNLGNALTRLGRVKEAIATYEKALQILPTCTTAKAELGAIYMSIKEFDRAEKLLVAAVRENPNVMGTHYNLGLLYNIKGKYPEALSAFESFLSLCSDASLCEKVRQACAQLKQKVS